MNQRTALAGASVTGAILGLVLMTGTAPDTGAPLAPSSATLLASRSVPRTATDATATDDPALKETPSMEAPVVTRTSSAIKGGEIVSPASPPDRQFSRPSAGESDAFQPDVRGLQKVFELHGDDVAECRRTVGVVPAKDGEPDHVTVKVRIDAANGGGHIGEISGARLADDLAYDDWFGCLTTKLGGIAFGPPSDGATEITWALPRQ